MYDIVLCCFIRTWTMLWRQLLLYTYMYVYIILWTGRSGGENIGKIHFSDAPDLRLENMRSSCVNVWRGSRLFLCLFFSVKYTVRGEWNKYGAHWILILAGVQRRSSRSCFSFFSLNVCRCLLLKETICEEKRRKEFAKTINLAASRRIGFFLFFADPKYRRINASVFFFSLKMCRNYFSINISTKYYVPSPDWIFSFSILIVKFLRTLLRVAAGYTVCLSPR